MNNSSAYPAWRRTAFRLVVGFGALLCCAIVALVVTSGPVVPEGVTDERVGKWRADVAFFAEKLPKRHENLFFQMPEEYFRARIADLDRRLPELSDAQIYVELARIVAAAGDSHTSITSSLKFKGALVKFQWFSDGIYATVWGQDGAGLAGRRLVGIEDKSVDEVITALGGLVPYQNEAGLRARVPSLLSNYDILAAAGIIPETGVINYWVEERNGRRHEVSITAGPLTGAAAGQAYTPGETGPPLYLERNDWFWFEPILSEQAIYIQYNRCWDRKLQKAANPNDPNLDKYPDFDTFTASVLSAIRDNPVRTIIVDLRNNGGGSSVLGTRFIKALAAHPKVKAGARIVGIIGAKTFSSAMMNALDLQKIAKAKLYGEPTSGKPNQYGEVKYFQLPNSGWTVGYSTRFFKLVKNDPDSVYPDVRVDLSYQDYVDGRDPALEAILRDYGPAGQESQ